MTIAPRLVVAGLLVASVAMVQIASATGSVAVSPSTGTSSCGPNRFLCRIGTLPQCVSGNWTCLPISSSSSSTTLPCGALNLMCMINTTAQCSNGHWTCVPNQTKQHPHISSLSPKSGPAGTMVTITGTGFLSSSGNTVYFGSSRIIASSSDGTHITFTVPSTFTIPCLQKPPYCRIATFMLKSGIYRVRVATQNGFSNVAPFRLVSGPLSSRSSSSVH